MKTNIDIDRISLEDRVTTLEGKVSGPSTSPGAPIDYSAIPKIIDQCPENKITNIGSGVVLRLEIPNFYDAPFVQDPAYAGNQYWKFPGRCLNGLALKIAAFAPFGPGQVLTFIRASAFQTVTNYPAQFTANQQSELSRYAYVMRLNLPGFNFDFLRDIASQLFQDAASIATHWTVFSATSLLRNAGIYLKIANPTVWDTLAMNLNLFIGVGRTDAESYIRFVVQPPYRQIKSGSSISHYLSFGTILPSYSFGCIPYDLPSQVISVGGHNAGWPETAADYGAYCGGFTVASPRDLPAKAHRLYPPSWYA